MTLTPEQAALVERLQSHMGRQEIEVVLRDCRLAATLIEAQAAEIAALGEALEPVMHWYQSNEHEERALADVVADAVADLQHDRALALAAWKLHFAGADLSICAQTTGVMSGPDSGLMLAIRQWEEADAPFRESIANRAARNFTGESE